MKGVLALLLTLLISLRLQQVAADCNTYKPYKTTFLPACDQNDTDIKWPNYEDPHSFYKCFKINAPTLIQCAKNGWFSYVLQDCGGCENYVPAIQCSSLPTQNPPKCYDIGGSTPSPDDTTTTPGLPTPNYPSSSPTTEKTTAPPTTKTTKTTATPTEGTATPTTEAPPTEAPPTEAPPTSQTDIPPISSPSTSDPNVPQPPTPQPTPPTVPVEPGTEPPAPPSSK